MTLKQRIWSLPAIIIVVFFIGIGISLFFTTDALSLINRAERAHYPALDQSKVLLTEFNGIIDELRSTVSEGEKSRLANVEEREVRIKKLIEKLAMVPGEEQQAKAFEQAFDSYYKAATAAVRIMLDIDKGDPQTAVGKMQSTQNAFSDQLEQAISRAANDFSISLALSASRVRTLMAVSIGMAFIVVLSLVLVSYLVIRVIWRQLGGEPAYAQQIAVSIAAGDFSIPVNVAAGDDRSLLAALAQMKGRLALMISDIQDSAHVIHASSQEIAQGNADLSTRTESQASGLQETAASMKKLTVTVKQNADSAHSASQLAASASSIATKGGDVVEHVIDTMAQINESSRKIGDIVGVIEGIAFQTNILALNAAVEAAHAGEQGRGFSVVASEVRNLARHSAEAVKEIQTLVDTNLEKIAAGSQFVNQAGRTMEEIMASVKKVTDFVNQIATASMDQGSGIEQISQSIVAMDGTTQQNAALVEEAAAATELLRQQAARLTDAVSVFKLSDEDNGGGDTSDWEDDETRPPLTHYNSAEELAAA